MANINPQAEDVADASLGGEQAPKLKRKDYEKELRKLQGELCDLQDWVKKTGQRIIVVFEGRDLIGAFWIRLIALLTYVS